ncbi:MAG: hypothetical protein IJ280_06690 [Bacteroidales bacterium]|nr:hypothetical protein [Bacteroidales bacterium]
MNACLSIYASGHHYNHSLIRRGIEPIGFELLPEVFTMTELQNLYEAILEVKFDRRNFYNKMLKLGILSEAEPRPANATNRTPNKYRFNAEKYAELKQKGLDWSFRR